ncbi:aldose 1-epimerase family protein [Chitinophaga lutea]
MHPTWHDKISHHAQLGGIETSVLDNGPGRGNRIAWFNTGAGLRFKVLLDRAMDVGEAFFNQHSLAWLSYTGQTAPAPSADRGLCWLNSFGGGLFTTCGLTHVGGPETDEYGERGLHDRISHSSAELLTIRQPDPRNGELAMEISGVIKQSTALGVNLELRRTISAELGKNEIRLHDEVINRGNTPAPHMLLYHFNFGWPLADEGAELLWEGDWEPRDEISKKFFDKNYNFRRCPPPLANHAGTGEAAIFIDSTSGPDGWCSCGVYNPAIPLAAILKFRKSQLPWLTNWQHWGPHEYVTGLEPGTHPPIGQSAAREKGTLIWLEPGERRSYDLAIQVLHQQPFTDQTIPR